MIAEKIKQKLNSVLKRSEIDDLLFAMPFNLMPDNNNRCDGIVAIGKNQIFTVADGKLLSKKDSESVISFECKMGVGCALISYQTKDLQTVLLCRTDLSHIKRITKTVRKINNYFENGILVDGKKTKDDKCPICSRPYKEGSTVCPYCSDKKKIVYRVWELFKPYKLYVFLSVALFFVISALSLVLPYINKIAIDDYIQSESPQSVSLAGFALVLLSMLALEIFSKGFSILRSHLLVFASNKMIVDLRSKLFNKIERLSIDKISSRTAGDIMHRVTSDTNVVDNFLVNYLPTTLEQVVIFIAVGIFLLIYDLRLFVMVLAPTPFVIMSFWFFRKIMRGLFHRRWTAASKTNSVLHDIFSGIRVVKAFGMEHKESIRFEKATREEKRMQIKSDCIWSIIMPMIKFLLCFGEFVILYYVGNKILDGSMTIGEMTQFSSYAALIYAPLRRFAHIPRHLMQFTTSATKIFEILDETEDVADSLKPKSFDINGDIAIKDVSFGYENGDEVLHKINIDIKKGEFVGLVGASGVGKSTLINLIMRMYDVDDGSIEIDGVDIRDISQNTLRSQMGIVLQETFLFSGSVFQNIAYAKQNATREEVIAVSKLAGCHDFIMRMPDGYNTRVGEKGYTLSGGERQRVAIARALLHNPKILILDEATASLDTETEKQIQDALARLSSKRTTIAIAHRLSTLRNATKLVVFDKGRVVQTGSHDELMQDTDGIYYSLVMAQREMSEM